MNILILSWRGPKHPNAGGAEIVIHEYSKGWINEGHKVTLFTSFYKGAKEFETIDGIEIIRRGDQIIDVQLKAFWWYLFENKTKFDLVIDNFHGIPFFTPLYIRIKKLAMIHEVTKDVWSLNPLKKPFNLIPTLIGPLVEPIIFKLFYKKIPFLTVSASTKSDLVRWGIPEKNINVIPNGINIINPSPVTQKEKKKTIVFLGALAKDKGIEDALECFKEIANNLPGRCQFWIVGKGESHYEDYLKKKVDDLGLSKEIKFWGFVSEEKKFELLKRAHLLINPSRREGWGLVVIEGASMGVPTVGFDVPGLRDSVVNNKTGILSETSNTILAKNIIYLINNPKFLDKLSKECIIWSQKFKWETSIRESLKLLEKLTKNT